MMNYEEKRKKIEQEQIINSILNNREMEHEALVKAAKEMENESQEKIQKRKKEILIENKKKERERNQKELDELDIQNQLDKWNDELEQEKIKRANKVNAIMKEINNDLEKKEREKFRNKNRIEQQKIKNLLKQLKELEIKEKIEEKNVENDSSKSITINNTIEKREQNINKIEQKKNEKLNKKTKNIQKKQSEKEKIKRGQEIINKSRGTRKFKNLIEKINPFKKKKAIEAYRNSIDNYNLLYRNKENSSKNKSEVKKQEKLSTSQCLFGKNYKSAYIDHKKANEKANKEDLEKTSITFSGRIIE